ncbi:Anti-anti-sigma regulatory factor (antagonist of anti-sigma factor) [Nonomuraea solani]|uniref:Anti-anti-sigma regulatory factor (Antagonist of anti-sigma factor) n=1 Tax=Nonomuraea solani TaxID=1144553 RepID=A0A1H6ENA4_9ACTN|nr:STAS domain-containing protein [Nonomuraea solani]SEG98269.1 Anti-anti-sigma regulatory factor (antagonist of anti-sigma factor) [Nonomuraea solani]
MMQLAVRLVPVDDTTLVIALTGELDTTTRPVLAAFLDPLPQSPIKIVLVAAGDLWFCDLNGLEQLAITHRALQEKGGYLAVAEAQQPLCRLIALMAEQDHPSIPVYTSMPEALADAGVEAYRAPETPAVERRHLPSVRLMARAQSSGRDRKRAPRRKPQIAQPAPPVLKSLIELNADALPPIISQSRTLREQAAHHQQAIHQRLDEANEARDTLTTSLRRCDDSLEAMRVNLVKARTAMAAVNSSNRVKPRFPGSIP